jgi:hypothetical protein
MRKYLLLIDDHGHPLCAIIQNQHEIVLNQTQRMRLMPHPLYVAIRGILKDKSINPESSYIATVFPDGEAEHFCVVVYEQNVKVFIFQFESDGSYELLHWKDCTADSNTYRQWKKEIHISVALLEGKSS